MDHCDNPPQSIPSEIACKSQNRLLGSIQFPPSLQIACNSENMPLRSSKLLPIRAYMVAVESSKWTVITRIKKLIIFSILLKFCSALGGSLVTFFEAVFGNITNAGVSSNSMNLLKEETSLVVYNENGLYEWIWSTGPFGVIKLAPLALASFCLKMFAVYLLYSLYKAQNATDGLVGYFLYVLYKIISLIRPAYTYADFKRDYNLLRLNLNVLMKDLSKTQKDCIKLILHRSSVNKYVNETRGPFVEKHFERIKDYSLVDTLTDYVCVNLWYACDSLDWILLSLLIIPLKLRGHLDPTMDVRDIFASNFYWLAQLFDCLRTVYLKYIIFKRTYNPRKDFNKHISILIFISLLEEFLVMRTGIFHHFGFIYYPFYWLIRGISLILRYSTTLNFDQPEQVIYVYGVEFFCLLSLISAVISDCTHLLTMIMIVGTIIFTPNFGGFDLLITITGQSYKCLKLLLMYMRREDIELQSSNNVGFLSHIAKYEDKTAPAKNHRTKAFKKPNMSVELQGPLFTERTHNGKPIPATIKNLQMQDTRAFIASLLSYEFDNAKSQTQANINKEIKRQLNSIRTNWTENLEELRNVLVSIYSTYEQVQLPVAVRSNIPHHKFESDPRIYIDEFDHDKWWKPSKTFPEGILNRDGFIRQLVLGADRKSNQLTIRRIKSMLSSLVKQCEVSWTKENPKNIMTYDKIVNLFKEKCWLWPENALIIEEDFPKLSWCIPYISPTMLSIGSKHKLKLCKALHDKLSTLKGRIIQFVRNYLKLADVSKVDRKLIFDKQKEAFKNKMRNPEIQAMFAAGVPRQQILDHVYRTNIVSLTAELTSNSIIDSLRHKEEKKSTKNRLKQRDKRVAQWEDFEPQSGFAEWLNVPSLLKISLPWWTPSPKMLYRTLIESNYVQFFWSKTEEPENFDCVKHFWLHFQEYRSATDVINRHNWIQERRARFCCFVGSVQNTVEVLNRVRIKYHEANYMLDMLENYKCPLIPWYVPNAYVFLYISSAHLEEVAYQAQVATTTISKWYELLTNPSKITSEQKLLLLEIKTAFHVFWKLYNNDNKSAMEWSSNFLLSRPDSIFNIIKGVTTSVKEPVTDPIVEKNGVFFDGKDLNNNIEAYELTPKRPISPSDLINDEPIRPEIPLRRVDGVPQSFTISDTISMISRGLSSWGLYNMTPEEVRQANYQFAYLNHSSRDYEGKAGIAMKVISVICRTFFNLDPFDDGYQKYVYSIIENIKQMDELANAMNSDMNDRPKIVKLLALYKEMLDIKNNPRLATLPNYLQRIFSDRFKTLETKAAEARSLLRGTLRDEPVCLLFCGPPGVGKSSATESIADYICAMEHVRDTTIKEKVGAKTSDLPKRFLPEMMYYFNTDDEFWEGYRNQKFFGINDFMKETDMTLRYKQAGCIINAVDVTRMPLNMASLEYKGITDFTSEYIFLSTNIANNGYAHAKWECGLTDPTAMQRRFHIVVYKNTKFDILTDKIDEVFFRVEKCIDPTYEGKDLTTPQLAALMIKLRQRFKENRQMMHNPDDVVSLKSAETMKEFDLQSGLSLSEIILVESIKLSFYSWARGPYANIFISICTILTSAAFLKMIYDWIFEPEQPNVWFEEQTKNYQKGSLQSKLRKPGVKYNTIRKWSRLQAAISKPKFKPQSLAKETFPESVPSDVSPRPTIRTNDLTDNFDRSIFNNVSKCLVPIAGQVMIDGKQLRESAVATHVKDGVFDVPAHFLLKFEDHRKETEFIILLNGKLIRFHDPDLVIMEDTDKVLMKVPYKINLPPSAFKYMLSEHDMYEIPRGCALTLVGFNCIGQPIMKTLIKVDNSGSFEYGSCGHQFVIADPLNYLARTEPGDSGSAIALMGNQGEVHIIGTHIGFSYTRGCGIAQPVCKELYEEGLALLNSQEEEEVPFETQSLEFPHKVHATAAIPYYHPKNSKFKQSPLHGCFGEVKYVPAHLKPFTKDGITIDPYLVAVKKLHQEYTPESEIPPEVLDYLAWKYPRKEGSRVLTAVEALKGIRSSGSIVGSTSAGYPYCIKSQKGKMQYIRLENNEYVYTEEGRQIVEAGIAKLYAGEDIEVIWADCLKDELRDKEKVDLGKTRLFVLCPFDYCIMTRMWCLDFFTYVKERCVDSPISVGINAHSQEWNLLYQRFLKYANGSIVAGDFSNYDGKLVAFAVKLAVEFINWWYDDGPVNADIRRRLFKHVYEQMRIYGDKIYCTKDGNPSGFAGTAILGSIVNIIMAFTIMVKDLGLNWDEWDMACYGDDNIIAIKYPGITVATLTPLYKKRFDMDYTHWSKKDAEYVETLQSLRYLGRKFYKSGAFMLAPLEEDVIDNILYWYKKGSRLEMVMLESMRSFMLECSHLTCARYTEKMKELGSVLKEVWPEMYFMYQQELKPYVYYIENKYCVRNVRFTEFIFRYNAQLEAAAEGFETQSNPSKDINLFGVVNPIPQELPDSRSTEFSERAVNEPTVTQEVELGGHHDVAPSSASTANNEIFQDPFKVCNIEQFSLSGVLNREYPIGNLLWSTDQATGTLLAGYLFPKILFDQPFILDKIKYFRYFRGGIRVTLRCVTNKFTYGKIQMSWLPMKHLLRDDPQGNVYSSSGLDHIILSASAGEASSLDVPFVYDRRFLDIKDYLPNDLGQFNIRVLNPLTDIQGSVANVRVFVTAQFLDAQVMLPFSPESRPDFSFEPQTKGSEAAAKAKSGTISSALEKATDVAGVLQNVPMVSPYASLFKLAAKPAAGLFRRMGLSKPVTTAITQINKINPYADLNYGKGLDFAMKLAMDPENGITTQPIVGGHSDDEMQLTKMVGTPMLTRILELTPTSISQVVCNLTTNENCYVDWISRMFMYWSGTFKVKAYITASTFHSVRLVFWLSSSTTSTDWENCYYHTVDVQGDTEISFSLPFIDNSVMSVNYTNPNVNLYVSILSWNQPDMALNCPIYLNIYKAGDADFQFGALREQGLVLQSNPRADFLQVFDPIGPGISAYSHDKLVCGEQYTTLREVAHRYSAYSTVVGQTGQVYRNQPYTNISDTIYVGIEMISQFFCFRRGSMRMKLLNRASTGNLEALYVSLDGVSNLQGYSIFTPMNPVMEFETPYYSNKLFLPTSGTADTDLKFYTSVTTAAFYMFKSAGDDFSLHLMRPLPYNSYFKKLEGAFGAPALLAYMN